MLLSKIAQLKQLVQTFTFEWLRIMLKTVENLSMVIPCFAIPTSHFLQVQFKRCNWNYADNMKQKSKNQIVRFLTGICELS